MPKAPSLQIRPTFLLIAIVLFSNTSGHPEEPPQKKKNRIKKPLNAFMLFMKEQRPKVIAECTLRESSAINQILGRRVSDSLSEWHQHLFFSQNFPFFPFF